MSESEAPGANAPEFSVSELSSALKRAIEDRFGYVRVRGEVSGYRGPHSSGHVYFSLKDANARLDAVIWKGVFARMRVKPEEGLEVVVTGKITTFPGKSAYQIIVESLEPAGVGALMALLEARRRKLAEEGLFDAARKQLPPYLPRVIGVVTSPTGAVIRDILHRLSDRFPVHVLVWPVRVQGETSAAEVAQAIRGFNALAPGGAIPRPDLLIVARGGGSLEDLWSFNEEIVVRAAAESDIPLIAAVGHETDWTLIDHAADVRAPTPTAAAEMSVPVRAELLANLADLAGRLRRSALRLAERRRAELRALVRALPSGDAILAAPRQRLDAALARLRSRSREASDARSLAVALLSRRLARQSPRARLAGLRERQRGFAQRLARAGAALAVRPREALQKAATDFLREARRERRAREDRLAAAARRLGALTLMERRRAGERTRTLAQIEARLRRAFAEAQQRRLTRLAAAAQVLSAVSYRSVLERGFALVRDAAGAPLPRASAIAPHQPLRIEFADGEIAASADGGGGEPATRRAKPRTHRDDQGSLF
jgi:exodeoxyribonuclease VII large subunit